MQDPELPPLTTEAMTEGVWRFAGGSGAVIAECIRFYGDGTVYGCRQANVQGWALVGGVLRLLTPEGEPVVEFDAAEMHSGLLTLQGRASANAAQQLHLQRRPWPGRPPVKFATRELFANEVEKLGWQIGEHTYGRPIVFEQAAKLIIGKYTSIALGTQIVLANHCTDLVSTYPFVALGGLWPSAPKDAVDHVARGDVVIGNDVWLGASCFIGPGVNVADGAVVGAHAVVVEDVPPYTIVVGNPARIVRMRFNATIVDKLLRLAWWDWPDEKVDRYLPLMLADNIQQFIREARREEKRAAREG